jgi:AraC-like DNA-binding protein
MMYHWGELIWTAAGDLLRRDPATVWFDQLWQKVRGNLANSWTVEELASVAGMSGELLRQHCRRELGCSVMEHVTALRIELAKLLLTGTDHPVSAIARRVGYGEGFGFSKAFKRYTKMSASDFRTQAMTDRHGEAVRH